MSASSSSTGRVSRTLSNQRGRSTSPSRHHLQTTVQSHSDDKSLPDGGKETVMNTSIIPVIRNLDNEEPIRLSKFSGGYEPDPDTPRKIESLDWPAPPYPAAVPELRVRSRSSSNRRATSTVTSIHGTSSVNGDYTVTNEPDEDDTDEDNDDEEVKQVLVNQGDLNDANYQQYLINNRQSAASVSSSLARVKASRPNSKLRYQNNLFDNDYDDYLLKYKSDREWKKIVHRNIRKDRAQSGEDGVAPMCEDLIENEQEEDEDEVDEEIKLAKKKLESKLKREIEEISKIENESSMAAELLTEIKAHQKVLARKLKLDPWKASRTPSANAEPPIRTRFESPVNACKLSFRI